MSAIRVSLLIAIYILTRIANRMPKIEKDCHSFTIKAEREKYRELINLTRQSSKGVMNSDFNPNSFSEKNIQQHDRANYSKQLATSKKNCISMHKNGQIDSDLQLQFMIVRTRSQGQEMNNPLHENLSLVKSKSVYREPSAPVLHSMKSDSTLDTDGATGSRNEERITNVQVPSLIIHNDRSRYGTQNIIESAKKKLMTQQNISELEKISKRLCTEGVKKSVDPKAISQENSGMKSKFKEN